MFIKGDSGHIWVLCLAIFLYILAVSIGQLSFVVDANYMHEESRTLFKYHQSYDPDLFSGDYITSFVDAFSQPYLYDWMTRLWLSAGGDLITLHRLLPIVCWLTFLAGMAVVARHLGDVVTMLAVLGITVAQPIYLHQITSALPHAFAFPLLIWAVVALLYGSVRGLSVVTLSAGLLYPAVAPLSGLLFAWHVFFARGLLSRPTFAQLKVLFLLTVTGIVSLWLVLDAVSGTEHFGAGLAPAERSDVYPENGPQGRHFYGVFNPLMFVASKGVTQFMASNNLHSLALLVVYCLVSIYGFFTLRKGSAGRKALFAFVVCGAIVFLLVFFLKPFHSYRFVIYPAFTVLPLLFVVGLQQFCLRFKRIVRFPGAVAVGLLALFALSLDSFDQKKIGYWWHLEPESRQVMAFAAQQPPRTLFATWPGTETPLELIPYIARRPLFVMRKAHYPTHEDHILTMRARTDALIDAYLATEEAALRRLRCRWGVDYLIVNKAHFTQEDSRPRYFAPFDDRIEETWRGNRNEGFLLQAPDPEWVALETGNFFILRLGAIAPGGLGESPADCGSLADESAPD